jgi:hypothetical protein
LEVTVGSNDYSFPVTTRDGASGTTRLEAASTLTEPTELAIRHSKSVIGGETVDRHNLIVSKSERDSESGKVNRCQVSLTITVPRTGQFSNAEVLELRGIINEALEGDNLGKFLRNES